MKSPLQEIKNKRVINTLLYPIKVTKKEIQRVIATVVVLLISIIFLTPLVVSFTNSFMSESEISENYQAAMQQSFIGGNTNEDKYVTLKFIPEMVTIKQYYQVLVEQTDFIFFFWNSVKIVLPMIFGQMIVASMAAYAFSKFSFKFRDQLFFIYIVTMLMPYQVTLVPNYIISDKMHLVGNQLSIILPGIFSTFGVFLLRQFMMFIPDEYCEAAKIDGANHFQIFTGIILPMTKVGLAALAILLLIDNWNMVEQPIVFLKELKDYPLSIALSKIDQNEVGIAFAASTLYMMPLLLVFLYGENYLVEGLQLSGIKG